MTVNWGDERMPERFWNKVAPEPNSGCWLWTGGAGVARKNYGAYGKYTRDGRCIGAHRASWEGLVGTIATGLQIDHLCRTPECVNPAHLEPVTPRINTLRSTSVTGLRAFKAAQTHCKNGHEWTAENTSRKASGSRVCTACVVARGRERTANETVIAKALRMYSPRRSRARQRSHCKHGHELSGNNVILKLIRRSNRPTKELTIVVCRACRVEQAKLDYERERARGSAVVSDG